MENSTCFCIYFLKASLRKKELSIYISCLIWKQKQKKICANSLYVRMYISRFIEVCSLLKLYLTFICFPSCKMSLLVDVSRLRLTMQKCQVNHHSTRFKQIWTRIKIILENTMQIYLFLEFQGSLVWIWVYYRNG